MSTRTDKFTVKTKQLENYSDFTNNLDLNPITGFLSKVSDEASIKQAMKNLIYTNRTERYYNSHIGSKLRALLFEPIEPLTETLIRDDITETLNNNEPRITLIKIDVRADDDSNQYNITIFFSILNISDETFDLQLTLKRVR